jgi:serine protease Do
MDVNALIRKPLAAAVLGGALVAVPAAALLLYSSEHSAEAAAAAPEPAPRIATPATPLASGLPDFRPLVQRYGPAVVNVSVSANARTAGNPAMPPGFDGDNPLFRHFGVPMVPGAGRPMRGEGSGFIVSADGTILTNAHVVDGAGKVTVKLTDHREFEAKVVGVDARSDVAVLKIEATGLPVVTLGDPGRLEVGEWVVAIGSPFGFENTVTAGIVSAKGRSLPDDTYVPFIQTDVAVNPGNSGGPLFNLRGEVVGINSQIYSRSGGYQGVSFAIPIDVAMNVGEQLQATGHVKRGKLGVGIQGVDQALAESFGLDAPRGALVSNVEQDGPADKAGLKEGDVILAFDGQPIDSAGQLPAAVAAAKPGRKVELQVWRDGASRNIDVTLGEVTDGHKVAANTEASEGGRLGMMVRPLSPAERSSAQVEAGLVVEQVAGAAAEAGIQRGDVVLSANGRPVGDVEQLRSIVEKAKSHVALLVQRGEARIFVPVELA